MTILLTGGCGFVGLNVAEQPLSRGDHVVIADLLPLPEPAGVDFARLPGRLDVVRVDVSDRTAVDRAGGSRAAGAADPSRRHYRRPRP